MMATGYEPLNTLKPVADGLWLIDGPSQLHGRIPYPTRATVVRLADGGLWVHSPTKLTDALQAELDALGPVAHLVAPNHGHVTHIAAWAAAYPQARCWAAPGADVPGAQELQMGAAEDPWAGQLDQIVVRAGRKLREAAFSHRASRTLILTDLIEALETQHLPPHARPIVWLSGTDHTSGHMRPSYRWSLKSDDKSKLADDVDVMIGWGPKRIIIAHGRWFRLEGVPVLEQAFRKVLRARRWEEAFEEHERLSGQAKGK